MKLKRIIAAFAAVTLLLSTSYSAEKSLDKVSELGKCLTEISGKREEFALNYANQREMLNDMQLVCQNSSYALYYHPTSLSVGIIDKKTGKCFLSNAFNAATDEYYTGEIAERLDSQIIVNYINSENVANRFYSSNDCVKLGQYKVRLCENGLSVDYSLGEEREYLICPEIFTENQFEALLSKMDSNVSGKVEYFYYLADKTLLSESEYSDLIDKYPIAKKEAIYVLTEINKKEQTVLDNALRSVGYDDKSYKSDLKRYDLSLDKESTANIKLTLEYLLTNSGLKVTIPRSSISFDSEACYLQSIDVLPNFGADSQATGSNGYLFIPDGSGAIISYADQSDTRRRIITGRVYGYDKALDQTNYKNLGEQYYLPVFGAVRNNASAFFAVIESGDSMSEITAMLGAPNSNYYSVYNTFLYTAVERVTMAPKVNSMNSARNIYLHDNNVGYNDFIISYLLLDGEQANISSMAQKYREILMSDGMNEKSFSQNVNIESIGTALYEDSFLGFTYKREAELTSYDDNIKMLEYFKKSGLDDVGLSLTGWQKYGLDSSITKKLSFSSTLGGKKRFKEMMNNSAENNADVFFNIDICGVRYNRTFDGFVKKRDTAKLLDGRYANLSLYDAAIQAFTDEGFLVSPSSYTDIIRSFIKSADKNSIANINFGTLGVQLNSDFRTDNGVNREETKNILTEIFSSVSQKHKLAFNGANAYTLPFATQISDVPLKCSEYPGETASVPFLQMSVGGCVKCVSEPVNLSGVSKTMLLNCVAYGISPSYTLAYENVEQLKLTDYTEYYAVNFDILRETVVEDYQFVKKAFDKIEGSRLVSFEAVTDDVSRSKFENGTVIYVNTGNKKAVFDGITVAAGSYAVA